MTLYHLGEKCRLLLTYNFGVTRAWGFLQGDHYGSVYVMAAVFRLGTVREFLNRTFWVLRYNSHRRTSVEGFVPWKWYLVWRAIFIHNSHQRVGRRLVDSGVCQRVSFEKGILGHLAWRQVSANVWWSPVDRASTKKNLCFLCVFYYIIIFWS